MNIKNKKAFKCKKCGRLTYPRRVRCLQCKSTEFGEMPFTDEGEILTFSQLLQLPWGIDDRYLTFGVIRFDNGIKAMGRITTPDVSVGDRVKASWEKFRVMAGEDIFGWVFAPVK